MIIKNSEEWSSEALRIVADNPSFRVLTKKLEEIGRNLELEYDRTNDRAKFPKRLFYERVFIWARHKNSNEMPELIDIIDDIPKDSGVSLWVEKAEKLNLAHVFLSNLRRFTEKDAIQTFGEYIAREEQLALEKAADRESRRASMKKIEEFNSELSPNKTIVHKEPEKASALYAQQNKGLWQKFKSLFV